MKHKHTMDDTTLSTLETGLAGFLGQAPPLTDPARKRIWRRAHAVTPSPLHIRRTVKAVFYPVFALMLVLGFLLGYGGVVVAASPSIPGDPLYPIERQAEIVWVSLTPDAERCEVTLVLMDRRVRETKALLEAGKPVPTSIVQEIEQLFLSLTEDPTCQTRTSDLLDQVTVYQRQLKQLTEQYPGAWGLTRALDAANAAVIKLGGDPMEALPQSIFGIMG